MSATFGRPSLHPVLACADAIETAIKETWGVELTFMRPEDKQAALVQLARAEAQLDALRLRLMVASDDVAQEQGARDVAAMVTHHTRTEASANRRDLALAESLDRRWHRAAEALAVGEINMAQARVVTQALDELPRDTIPDDVLARAEEHLVGEAAHFGPRELRLLGRRVLEVVAPEIGEEHEARQLEREEQRAWRRTSLVSTRLGDGVTRIVIKVPDGVAMRLNAYLEAFTSPRHAGVGEGDRVPIDVRRGQAFCALLETWDARRLPVHGGDATTVIVTVPIADLRRELGVGELGPSDALSAGEVRRLACTSAILPAVLDGRSEVLDLGRTSRLFKPAQRKAMVIRDRECRGEGCTIPAAWCEAHHLGRPWSQGGRTDLRDGVLLCPWHHHRAHDPTYDLSRLPHGDVRFTRRR